MTIDKIIEYVIDTPGNVNKAVLRSMLETLVEEISPDPEEVIYYDGGDVKGY